MANKIGRHKNSSKNKNYIARNRRYTNKLKRVRKSCGEEFAKVWKEKYGPRRS